jgi:GTPase SAR1 family protein
MPVAISIGSLIGRDSEIDKLATAIRRRKSQLIWGPTGAGKTSLIKAAVEHLPKRESQSCILWSGAVTGRELVQHFVGSLYRAGDAFVQKKVHADGAREGSLHAWLNRQSTLRLRGILFTAAENGNYRFFLDHVPAPGPRLVRTMKEFMFRCKTPVYLTGEGFTQREISYAWSLYWTDEYRIQLGPVADAAARELLETCIRRFGLERLDLEDFREEILQLSGRLPGAIVGMCELAADPRYHYCEQIKTKIVHVDYVMKLSANRFAHAMNFRQ